MALRKLGRDICSFLNRAENRGRWFGTRDIAAAVLGEEWPDAAQVGKVGQSLRGLALRGEVIRYGRMAEWRSSKWPELAPPQIVQYIEKRLGKEAADLLDRLEPELRRRGL